MFNRRGTILALSFCSALVLAGSAAATSVTSVSFKSWKTTLTGAPTEADFTAVQFTNYNTAAGLTLSAIGANSLGTTFTGPDNGNYSLSGTSYNGFTALAGSADSGAALNVVMPSGGQNAFLIVAGSTGATPLTLSLSDGESFAISSGLFGIAVSHPVSSFALTTTAGSQAVIDDFWFGNSALTQDSSGPGGSTPPGDVTPSAEGASLVLMAGGALILFGAWRKFGSPLEA